MNPLLIIGSSGFVGRHLLEQCQGLQRSVIGTSRLKADPWHFDLESPDLGVLDRAAGHGVRVAIITAAVTGVAFCEKEPVRSWQTNVDGTLAAIRRMIELGIKPVFFSSDYVFDGSTGSYADDSPLLPTTQYGRQKAAVEQELPGLSDGNYLILRPGKVFGIARGDGTLFEEMAELLARGDFVRAAVDQFFSPIFLNDLLKVTMSLIDSERTGAVNVCMPEADSRYNMALRLAEKMGISAHLVQPVELRSIDGIQRPLRTNMLTDRLARECKVALHDLDWSLEQVALGFRRTVVVGRAGQ